MTKAPAAQRRADYERLEGEFSQSVLRLRQVRETGALVREETRQVVEEAKARRQRNARRTSART